MIRRAIRYVPLTLLTCGIFLWLTATPAHAADSNRDEARRHFYVGVKLLKVDDFEGALIEFTTSLQIRSAKATLFNLVNTYQALHRYHDSLQTIARLRAEFGKQLDSKLAEHVNRIEADLLAIVSKVSIHATPDQAKVYYQDRLIGAAPLDGPLYVGPGDHQVLVSADGYLPREISFSVVSQEEKALDVELEPISGGPQLSGTTTGVQNRSARQKLSPTPFWVSAGITGAVTLGFLVVDLTVLGRDNKIEDGGQSDAYVQTTQNLQTADRILGLVSIAGLVTTGALALFTDFRKDKETAPKGFSLTGTLSVNRGPGLILLGRF